MSSFVLQLLLNQTLRQRLSTWYLGVKALSSVPSLRLPKQLVEGVPFLVFEIQIVRETPPQEPFPSLPWHRTLLGHLGLGPPLPILGLCCPAATRCATRYPARPRLQCPVAGTMMQWAPWQQVPAQSGAHLVAGVSRAPSASSGCPRDKSMGQDLADPRPDSDLGLNAPAPSAVPNFACATSPAPDNTIVAPPPLVSQEDFKAHQDLLKQVASSLQLQAEEMEGPSDSLFNILSPLALGRRALPLHQGVANITSAMW